MDLHPDFRDLLAEFAREGVRFVVVGGYAVGHYAKPRATKDLDLLVSGTADNLGRVARALERFGAPPNVVEAARRQAPSEILYLGTEPVRVEILREVDGIDTEHAISRSVTADLGDLIVPIVGLDDLIANKRASGRPQDVADAVLLEGVRTRRSP